MINRNGFSVDYIQAVLYTTDPEQFSQPKLLSTMLAHYALVFDADVIALPSFAEPEGLQITGEIPRFILKSSNDLWEFRAAANRLDVYWRRRLETDDHIPVLEFLVEVLTLLLESLDLKVGRLALLVNRSASIDQAAKEMAEHFLNTWAKNGPINRSDTIELHNMKRYSLPGIDRMVNSWVRCKSIFGTAEGENTATALPAMVVEQDLNTLLEEQEKTQFTQEEAGEFFQTAFSEIDTIFNQYFPSEV